MKEHLIILLTVVVARGSDDAVRGAAAEAAAEDANDVRASRSDSAESIVVIARLDLPAAGV